MEKNAAKARKPETFRKSPKMWHKEPPKWKSWRLMLTKIHGRVVFEPQRTQGARLVREAHLDAGALRRSMFLKHRCIVPLQKK